MASLALACRRVPRPALVFARLLRRPQSRISPPPLDHARLALRHVALAILVRCPPRLSPFLQHLQHHVRFAGRRNDSPALALRNGSDVSSRWRNKRRNRTRGRPRIAALLNQLLPVKPGLRAPAPQLECACLPPARQWTIPGKKRKWP